MSHANETTNVAIERLGKFNSVLNQDFCPWANKWVYWMKHPFWCTLLAVVASILCGLLVKTAVLGLALLLTIILISGTIWPILAMRGIDCELRIIQHRVRVGQGLDLCVKIINRWPWPIWGIQLKSMDGQLQSTALRSLKAWNTTEFTWRITALQRGIFPSQTPSIETGFPFGLYYASKPIKLDHSVIVWPQVVKLDALPDTAESQDLSERFSERHVGEFGDLMGTRAFRLGDSLRHVHWAQTARSGELIVCERQAPATTAITLLTDFSTSSHVFTMQNNTLETAITIAASICEYLHHEHGLAVCQIGNHFFRCGHESEHRQLMDTFARIPVRGFSDSELSKGHSKSARNLPSTKVGIITSLSPHEKISSQGKPNLVVVHDGNDSASTKISGSQVVKDAKAESINRVWRKICHAS